MATINTTTKMSATTPPQPTSPTSPQVTTREQTGIHWSTIYLHTVPGTLKCVCLVCFTQVFFRCDVSAIRSTYMCGPYCIYISFTILCISFQIFVLLGFLCIQFSQHSGNGVAQFYSTVTMIAFWFTGILLVLYLFHAIYVFHKIPWTKIEFYFCAVAMLGLMLVSALVAARGVALFTAAAVNFSKKFLSQNNENYLKFLIVRIFRFVAVLWFCGNGRIRLRCILEI